MAILTVLFFFTAIQLSRSKSLIQSNKHRHIIDSILSNNEFTLSLIKENKQLIYRILDRVNKLELNENTISNETHLIQQYLKK